ncbi:MAG: CbtA family protein [Pseudomonadota bacterium]|nr:CbtA family protein [Pseudomonadota bacterium]
MFRRIFFTAVIAGVLGGLAVSIVQHLTTTPIILHAESFELENKDGDKNGSLENGLTLITPAHAHGPHTDIENLEAKSWAPRNALERTLFTSLANVLTGIGFALILTACFALSGRPINGRGGVLWGVAGFAIISLAPALGLPPEVPGAKAAALGDRQLWWFLCIGLTAAGLWLMVFRSGPAWAMTGIALIALPHMIGVPLPERMGGNVPPELAAHFVSASLATAAVFWCTIGWMAGTLWNHFEEKGAS